MSEELEYEGQVTLADYYFYCCYCFYFCYCYKQGKIYTAILWDNPHALCLFVLFLKNPKLIIFWGRAPIF